MKLRVSSINVFPLKNKENGPERNTFQKNLLEKYANYKEALNLATTEIRKSKRIFEEKLAGNIKNYSKNFYAYVRSKQKVRDKVGPLENNRGNIISDGFQMAEVLNEYFSSRFTTEDISSPVPFLNLRAINQNI